MAIQFSPEQHKLLQDYLGIFFRRKYYILLPLLIGLAVGLFLSYTLPKEYRSTTMILVERQKIPDNYIQSTVTSSITDRLKTISQLVMSRTNLMKLSNNFDLYQNLGEERIVGNLRKKIELKITGNEAFSLSFSGEDPTTVMNVTNALASRVIEENLRVREEQAKVTTDFLQMEAQEAKKKLDLQDQALKQFKEKYMGALPEQLETNLRTLDRHQLELQGVTDQLRTFKEQSLSLEKQILEFEKNSFSTSPSDATIRLQQLKKELSNLQGIYKENYPDVILLKEQIQGLENELLNKPSQAGKNLKNETLLSADSEYRRLKTEHQKILSEISPLKIQKARLVLQIKDFERRVEITPKVEEELKNVMRDYTITEKSYQLLLEKSLNARISENLERRQKGEQFRIIDSANLPKSPYEPNVPLILLGSGGGGLALGVAFALLIEMFNPCFRKPEDFDGIIPYPILGTIPELPKETKKSEKPKNFHLIYGKRGKASF